MGTTMTNLHARHAKGRGRRRWLGVVLAGVLLAACGSDAEPAAQDSSAATTAAETESAPADTASPAATQSSATAGAAGAVIVEVAASDLGDVLVDADGRTLYVFDNDDVDTSACGDDCLGTWPALLAEEVTAADGVTAELGTFTRDDGDVQVTANGLPLYHYAADTAPGDVNGQGVGEVWWVVDPAGDKVTAAAGATADEAGYGDPDY